MLKTFKFAVSLPKDDFAQIENIRKKLKLQRSAIIDTAIRFWLENFKKEELIRKYEEGYKKNPESLNEIIAMEQEAAAAFKEENTE